VERKVVMVRRGHPVFKRKSQILIQMTNIRI
jgi:vacuolar-type H+-ATPase subunit D/Vma8